MNGKSGKISCCHHGGSWHKNCGNADDPNFDHTWTEGLRACLDVIQAEAQAHAMLSHQTSITLRRSAAQSQIHFASGSVDDVDTKNSQGYDNLASLIALISVLLVAVHIQM